MSPDLSTAGLSAADSSPSDFWTIWSIVASFGTYFCMYAFRKPFTMALPDGLRVHGVEMKALLVMAQVAGYMASKFIGVKVVAELRPQWRALVILLLISVAEVALVFYALTPAPWSAIWLFINGLPLGMVFGLVIGFLEGRQRTELLASALCASFIVADGFTKSLGAKLLAMGVGNGWMPAAAGGVAFPFLLVFVFMLSRIPMPSAEDVIARSARKPLDHRQRAELVRQFAPGLIAIVLGYLLITVMRSIRSDFAPELWRGLGVTTVPSTFTYSELIVGGVSLMCCGGFVFIRDNRAAFFTSLLSAMLGFFLVMLTLALHSQSIAGPFWTMVLIGLGLYVPYLAVHTTIFERLLAMTRQQGTVGYLLTLADAIGYLGYVVVLVMRQFFHGGSGLAGGFWLICWVSSMVSLAGLVFAWIYFEMKCPKHSIASAPVLLAVSTESELQV
jgi:hypothetical protein